MNEAAQTFLFGALIGFIMGEAAAHIQMGLMIAVMARYGARAYRFAERIYREATGFQK